MSEVIDFVKRVASRCGLHREKYTDNDIPHSISNIRIILFFGDIASEFLLSTLLLPRIYDKSTYTILCSWPGHFGLYPYVNEYWSITDEDALSDLARSIAGSDNTKVNNYERILLRYFEHVDLGHDIIKKYYDKGFTTAFFEKFKTIEYSLPAIPSVSFTSLQQSLAHSQKKSVLIYPCKYVRTWGEGRSKLEFVQEKFWFNLIQSLLGRKYILVVYQDYRTYDLSPDFSNTCSFIANQDIMAVLGVMRICDCVLDVFSGISRYALIARCPYLFCDERMRYFEMHDFVFDDLCGSSLPHEFLFTFGQMLNPATNQPVDYILNKLDKFVSALDHFDMPSSVESHETLSYSNVRKRELTRIGARLLRLPAYEE